MIMTREEKLELTRKIGLFGLKDLRKLAPIGDLGYANGWYEPSGDGSWMNGGMDRAIMKAFYEQDKDVKLVLTSTLSRLLVEYGTDKD